ncbi:hypothetical protein V502_03463 [Pseudogymnoascus sp. VKM F-4520 (FW-2644)]|nr:hypothetical protein V502_03463 [Pseudogymnoascus sp. VKM F-4520 (FW-2644)]
MREITYNEWQRAFRNEFTFFDDINCNTPETHADSIVQADSKLFAGVSTSDLVRPNSQQLGLIGIVWNRLCSDVTASVDADYDLSVRISKVAVRLIFLGDYHSATAILTGLRHAGIDLEKLSQFWHLIDMKDNFGAYRAEVSKRRGPLILFAFPHVRELALQSDTTDPSFNLFQYVRFPAVEGGLEGKTDPGFDCPIATVEGGLEGRTALDLDRSIEGELEGRTDPDFDCTIATVEGEFGGGPFLDFDRPIATVGGGFEGRTFLGIPDLADLRNDTAFHAPPKSSKHDDSYCDTKGCTRPLVDMVKWSPYQNSSQNSLGRSTSKPPPIVAYASGAQDAQSPSFLTNTRHENSFYGHPVINGQDFKERIARHVTIASPSLTKLQRNAGSRNLVQRARKELNRTKYSKTISASFYSARATTPKFDRNMRTEDGKTGETTNSDIRNDATDDGVSDRITVDSQSDDPAVVEQMEKELHQLKTRVTAKRKFGRETRKEKGIKENVRFEREIGMSGQCTSCGVKIRQMGRCDDCMICTTCGQQMSRDGKCELCAKSRIEEWLTQMGGSQKDTNG